MKIKEFIEQNLKKIRYIAEAAIVKFGIWFFCSMRPKFASDAAATIAKFVGKKISVHKLAYKNLSNAMPYLSEKEKEKILDEMWDNLGRIVGEYPHIAKYSSDQISTLLEVSKESLQNIEDIKQGGKGGIIFSAHIGNWEVGPKFFSHNNLKIKTVYRPLNNPYVEKITAAMRGTDLIEKGRGGNRQIIDTIKNNGFVIILADQRASDGDLVQFFHDKAITTTSIARIALKYNVPLIPVRSIRIGKNFKFRIEVEKPLVFKKTNDLNFDLLKLTRDVNLKIEEWVKEYPSQWFWVHNRWKK
jgi:Kdo2-lipid IVA lauroyltransferase/acyltransferase